MSRRREINEYLDGGMTPERRTAFEARMAAIPDLADEVAETQRVLTLLRSMPEERVPAELLQGVMDEVRQQPIPRRPAAAVEVFRELLKPRRLALAAAVGAILVFANVVAQPPDLNPVDVAFIEQSLTDFHYEKARLSSVGGAEPSLEVLDSGL